VNNNQAGNAATEQKTNLLKNSMSRINKKYILLIAQVITAIITVYVLGKTNTLNNTANMLQLNNTIQSKTDVYYSVKLKGIEMDLIKYNGGIIDSSQLILHDEESRIALASLLNAYEFACQQYLRNKIDRKEFKALYYELLQETVNIANEHLFDKSLLVSLYKVYTEWYVK
jgi:hypothetical protein